MNEIIRQRLEMLREVMRQEKIDAFIFPSTDPHSGEYVPEHWEGRKWISGFGGSAGTAVVTMERAALWTDSRYFIAAEEQLGDTEFVLMKERMEGTPSIAKGRSFHIFSSGSKFVRTVIPPCLRRSSASCSTSPTEFTYPSSPTTAPPDTCARFTPMYCL